MEGKSTDWVRGPSGPTVCRCCFAEGCYKDISTEYFWMGKREVYSEMLTETFDLSIAFAQTSGPNSNSRLICEPCISRLRDASEFKRQVQECEKMFMQYLDPGRTTVTELEMEAIQEPLEKEVKLEPVKLEKNHSDDDFDDRGGFDDMDEDDLDDQPLTKLASKVPKKESVDLLDLLDNAKAEKRKSSSKTKSSPAKKAKTKKETPKATASKPKPEKKKKGQKNEEADQANEDMTAAENTEDSLWRANLWNNVNTIIAMTTVYPFKYKANLNGAIFQCYYCTDAFCDPTEMRNHNRDRHSDNKKVPRPKCYQPVKMDFTAASCKVCAADIQNYAMLKTHLAEHGKVIDTKRGESILPYYLGSESNVCQICEKKFHKFVGLLRHMSEHSDRHRCKKCGQRLNSYAQLMTHIRQNKCSTRQKKSFDIENASASADRFMEELEDEAFARHAAEQTKFANFRNNISIITTMTTVYPFKYKRGLFQCYYCDTTSLNPHDIRSHNRDQHYDIKSFPNFRVYQPLKMDFADASCKLCLAEIRDYPTLKNHLAKHGNIIDTSLSESVIPYNLNKDEIVCQICNTTYQSFLTLHRHMNVHCAYNICDQCGKAFKTHSQLSIHRQTHESGVFPCKECNQTFPFLSRLHSHSAKVHKRKIPHTVYKCPVCKEEFPTYRKRLIHLSQVHGHKMPEFPCPSCNKVFNLCSSMTNHVKTKHLQKEKNHPCTLCDMKFSNSTALKDHIVKHNGERKFQCDICKKAYARIKTLREHMRIHNDDRRFACAVCGLTFIQKCSMKHHMRVHHPTEFKQEFES
ncbi:zinc finger protein 62 homolog isoform X1 [Cydia pomonella]|uniref:zinc finger protein 62 homolog isoform X1 n=1 Tax=Cydia pomonella TaxID=82600 RepID=UPI002ADD605C|nr:zinc finger protein 62 homolog isoform X1 [Cydia pomonella]